MNTSSINFARKVSFTAAVAVVITVPTAVPAFAQHTVDGAHQMTSSPFAQPIDALGGMTLAEYVQNHNASRTHAVV